ncbi:hypothetical protein EYD10_09643 [Varanus komodoensis]|nr:hypothetical protein EYD10_09643 [Varanus komodoensis]
MGGRLPREQDNQIKLDYANIASSATLLSKCKKLSWLFGLNAMLNLFQGSLEITQSVDDDPLLDAALLSPLHTRLHPKFHTIPTVCFANVLLLLHVTFVVLAFVAGVSCFYSDSSEDICPGNYTYPLKVQTVIIIAKVILWILYVVLERYVHFHHSMVRRKGYLLIYRTTRNLKRLPLLIQSTGEPKLIIEFCLFFLTF